MKATKIIQLTENLISHDVHDLFQEAEAYYMKKMKSIGCNVNKIKYSSSYSDVYASYSLPMLINYQQLSPVAQVKLLNKITKQICHFFPHSYIYKANIKNSEVSSFSLHLSPELSKKYFKVVSYSLMDGSVLYDRQTDSILVEQYAGITLKERDFFYAVKRDENPVEAAQIYRDGHKEMTDTLAKALRLISI